MTSEEMIERVARAIEGVRLFARWNDWTDDHVSGLPIEICRWTGDHDESCEVIARYPGERERDGIEHLERHVAEARAIAAIAAMQADADLERIKQERDQAVEALREGRRAIGDHIAPNDCYTTGPLTGDDYRDLVECPACSFIAMYDKALGGQHD